MADIRLSKVPSGTNQTIACTPDSRFVFDFSTDEATMTRSGDNLVFTFDDGGSVELTGFYTTYNSEEMPDFEVDGTTISGADFFTAMNEPDLMPAAGPATVTVADGARYHEYANSSLMGGLDRLGGLDLGFDRAEEPENDLYGLGMDGGNAPLSAENYGENIPSAEPEPSVPGNPDDDQNHDVTITPETPDPEVPGDPDVPADPSNPSTQGASVTVHESGLKDIGSQAGATEAPTTAEGVLDITAPDGVKSIELTFGGNTVSVNMNGTDSTIDTDEGTLTVSYAEGKLNYRYELTGNTTEHKAQGGGTFSHDITVKVTDTDGDTATSTIRVNVVDDAPVLSIDNSAATNSVSSNTPSSQLKFYNDASEKGNGFVDAAKVGTWDESTPLGPYNGLSTTDPITYKGFMDDVKIIATTVLYKGGDVSNFKDVGGQEGFDFSRDKHLYNSRLTGENNGLTIGNDGSNWNNNSHGEVVWNADEIGLNPEDSKYSEAVVLEVPKNTVSYGLNLELGSMTSSDKVLVTFMSTPQDNSDDVIVKQEYVDVSKLTNDPTSHWAHFDVPQGFTKVFISAVTNENSDYKESGFTLREVELLTNSAVSTGRVDVNYGADGKGGLTWDLSDNQWNNVEVINARGHGKYNVMLQPSEDGLTVTGTLVAAGASLNEHTLFTATLDPVTGEWTFTKFYEFKLGDKYDVTLTFTATDADNSIGTVTDTVPTTSKERLDRFDDVDTGYYDKKWGYDASKDHAVDVMAGDNGNDLMYGKGGNDILSGDGGKEAYAAIGDALGFYEGRKEAMVNAIGRDGVENGSLHPEDGRGYTRYNADLMHDITMFMKGEKYIGNKYNIFDMNGFTDRLAAIEKQHPDWNGDDALFGGKGDDILFGWGGDDYLHGDEGEDMIFAGGGDDLILYDKSDYLVHGGSGIDFLLSGKDDGLHLEKILKNNDTNEGPLVQGVEVLLKGDAVVTLTSLKELEDYGIKVDGDKLMLGEGWTSNGQYYTYGGGSLILETTLTGIEQDNGTFVFENANPSQIDELFSEDPYAIPDEALTFAALSSADQNKSRAFFPEDGDASQQGEEPVQGEYSGYMGAAEGKGAESSDDGLFEMSGSPASPLEEHTDALSLNDDVIGLEESGNMDDLLGVSGQPDAMKQEPDERSLELTNLDTSAYSGLDMERGENAAGADSPMPVADGMDPGICHGIETTEDHANEEALRAAITAMQADTGGC